MVEEIEADKLPPGTVRAFTGRAEVEVNAKRAFWVGGAGVVPTAMSRTRYTPEELEQIRGMAE